ncbi:methionine synthase [Magnetospira sp. QH-2]|uniref:methionine synthase n=1 Tax=Magnetospira sp. (strain QH-2) TaxID=1288970 RepID=UPI0003E815B9|nr:methionine synthase [Magnetospira sp. QH-2]CCQ72487.1 Methionine synthase [Magnetospira sp. QH-2]
MAHILDVLKDRVLLCDGGMGSRVQALDLDVDKDFQGHENCTDILTRSRPDVVKLVHRGYFEAGSDMVITNTFGTSPITLGEFGLQDEAYGLSREAAVLAREVADEFTDGRDRFVLGDVGPGTKLPSLGHIGYDELEAGLIVQCEGLVAGGVDAILIETCQDPLQIKAAVNGAKIARGDKQIPIFVQVTVETTGTLLVGADIAAATTVVHSLGVDLMGLNCATGPQEMAEHVKWLAENWPGLISVQPNAGLPELVDGQTVYPLGGEQLAKWVERFVEEDGVNIVGGCCGTNIPHIKALDAMLRYRAGSDAIRPTPKRRTVHWMPSVASLYSQVSLRQENAFLSIGERCNANGSKKFREAQEAEDWDACVAMARDQVREASHTIDVCAAFVGRDEMSDMTNLVERMRGSVTAPLVIDSTELPVIEAALKLYGGKAILNSINFEDGEEPAAARLKLARKYGAAVVALTIDEEGMAKTADEKLRIAHRLYDFAVNQHGLPASDLLFDPLTFTVCTGNEDDRKLAIETLEGIRRIRSELPECQIVLGLSNISFGLKLAARHVLNSVFLHHALEAGMTAAIVHVSKLRPLHTIAEAEVKVAEDLIFDRRHDDYDPLQEIIATFADRTAAQAREKQRPETVEERLKERIVDGDKQGLEEDLDEAMQTHAPLTIINTILLDGMKVVGELFGSGQMQLPFVLQSAETMKAAVAHLEPHMEKVEGSHKGTLVLATVKGDVHDIGKNLVDIILSNNGFNVVNLGIKQPVQAIIDAAKEHKADAVGMSGLLVKSTVIMRENLEEMTRQGLNMPILLGGAALTRKYVEGDCVKSFGSGRVAYARDAFDGLSLMNKTAEGEIDAYLAERQAAGGSKESAPELPDQALRPVDWEQVETRKSELHANTEIPTPPFWGAKIIEKVEPKALVPFLSETMLYQFQWGFKKAGRSLNEWKAWAKTDLTPILTRMLDICEQENILQAQAAYGYWKCASEGNDVVLFDEDGTTEVGRFAFPRQNRADGLCVADFFRDRSSNDRDVIALQAVTMGQKASDVARDWFAENRYQDYLYLHGLSVEMAEAMAEYLHKRVREELGFGHEDSRDMARILKQDYRGSRYSFGYPACPDMAQQRLLLDLLGADRIGLEMADEEQLHPEQSTAAVVVHHPQARYFVV